MSLADCDGQYKILADLMPRYDGSRKTLNYYIREVETLLQMISTPTHPALLCLIKSRLSGAAIDAIANEGGITDWQGIKTALQRRLGEPRNEIQLMQELTKMRKLKSEDAEAFGRRLRELLDTLNAVGTHTDKSYYENMAIEQYVNQLEFHICMGVRIAKPESLELAIVAARQEEARLNTNRFAFPSTSHNNPKIDTSRANPTPFKMQINGSQPRPFNPGFVPQKTTNWPPQQRPQWPQPSQPWKGKSSGNFRGSQMLRPQQNIPQQAVQQVNPPQRHSDVTMRSLDKPQKHFGMEELFYTTQEEPQSEYEQPYDYYCDSQPEMQEEDFCSDHNPDDHN